MDIAQGSPTLSNEGSTAWTTPRTTQTVEALFHRARWQRWRHGGIPSVEVSSDRSRPSTGDAIFEMSRVDKDIGGEVSSDCKPSTRSKRGAQRDRDPSARPPAVSVPGSPRTSAIGPRGCRVGIVRPRAGATTPGTARHARRRAR